MYEKTYGPKYEETKDLRVVEVAKLVRAEIKAAVKSGKLPKGKYSVRSDHNHIGVEISDIVLPHIYSDERLAWDEAKAFNHGFGGLTQRYSPEMAAALKLLEEIHGAYNYDGSDIQSDYFNVRYYGDVKLDWQWADRVLVNEKAEYAIKLEERAASKPVARIAGPVFESTPVLDKPARHLTLVKSTPAPAKAEPTNEYVEGLKLLGVL